MRYIPYMSRESHIRVEDQQHKQWEGKRKRQHSGKTNTMAEKVNTEELKFKLDLKIQFRSSHRWRKGKRT